MTLGNVIATRNETKTQTRRVWKPRPGKFDDQPCVERCPYGQPGDILALREPWFQWGLWIRHNNKWTWFDQTGPETPVRYEADGSIPVLAPREHLGYHRRPSIFLPKIYWRTFCRLDDVRVERLQEITVSDCIAEGVSGETAMLGTDDLMMMHLPQSLPYPIRRYWLLWNSINGKKDISFESNPWVWVLSFTRIKPT